MLKHELGALYVAYLSGFLCVALAVGLLASGCAGPRPLKGGRAVMTRTPAGVVEQTLVQSENPAQATKQAQESVKERRYTVPAGCWGKPRRTCRRWRRSSRPWRPPTWSSPSPAAWWRGS